MGCSLFQKKKNVLHDKITKQLQKHLAYSPQGRVNRGEMSRICHPVTFLLDDLNAEYQVSRGRRTKQREKQTKSSKLQEAMDFERTTSLPLLEINFQRRNPCCLFVFFFCHSTATKTKVLKRYNDPTSSFKNVSYEEQFFAEYLALTSAREKQRSEMHASARLGGHDTIPGALLESRVFRLSRMREYYARSLVIAEIRDYLQSV